MIKNLVSSSGSIMVTPTSLPYISPGAVGSGMVRYNSNIQQLEVNDGAVWLQLGQTSSIGLTQEAEQALQWAQQQLKREQELDALAKQHPGVKDLQEKLEIMVALVKQEQQ
jgi:hypothetical protein